MPSHDCPKCRGPMEQGFIIDRSYGHGWAEGPEWMAGTPEKSIWTGIKMRKRVKRAITSWRCTKCGFLESWAE